MRTGQLTDLQLKMKYNKNFNYKITGGNAIRVVWHIVCAVVEVNGILTKT